MSTRIAGALVVALSLAGPAGVWAKDVQPEQSAALATGYASPVRPTPDELGVSFEHIKFALEQTRPPLLKVAPNPPTFRIQIIEKHKGWLLPSFTEGLKIPWAPVPSGGRDYYEIMKMITPPEAQPFGAYTSKELPQAIANSLVASLIMYGLKHAVGYERDMSRERQIAEIRNEVRKELEDFLRANPQAPKPVWWTGTIK
jgi:hypothetical protein